MAAAYREMDRPMPGAYVNHRQVDAHLLIERYGDFLLTGAVRPGPGVPVVPREGFRPAVYRDRKHGFVIPLMTASISREKLFDVFLSLLEPLGESVDVVLETSHKSKNGKHRDLRRRGIDAPILASYCCEFEDLLTNDGCSGIAVMSSTRPMEVQFDEHKVLTVYAANLKPFRRIFRNFDIPRDDSIKLISEAAHLHATEPYHYAQFRSFCCRLGIGKLSRV
jgi:hypothetical protein